MGKWLELLDSVETDRPGLASANSPNRSNRPCRGLRRTAVGAIGAIGREEEVQLALRTRLLIPVSFQPVQWSVRDWQAYRDERAGIRQHDGGMSKAEAERLAYLDCIAMWLRRHPPLSEPVTAWTGNAENFQLCRIRDAMIILRNLSIAHPAGRLAV